MKCSARFLALIVPALLALLAGYRVAYGQSVRPNEYSRVVDVPREEVDRWLKAEVHTSSGDWDNQRYHFILGFSTGHFGQDPVHAIAMRRLAFSLLNNSLTAGDSVTPVAWEMGVWDIGQTITLTSDPQTRSEFVDRVPYTTRQGSLGGHDVEHTLYDLLTRAVPANEAHSTIILLFTNSNQSQGPSGQHADLFGADNPQLTEALQKADFRSPPVRHSFVLKTQDRELTVDVTALFPAHLETLAGSVASPRSAFPLQSWQPKEDAPAASESLPNQPAETPGVNPTRTDTVTNKTVTPRPAPPSNSTWKWLLGLALLVVLILVCVRLLKRPAPPPAQQQPVVAEAPKGRTIPGALEVLIGSRSEMLQPLSSLSRWVLLHNDAALPTLAAWSDQAAPEGIPLANLAFDEERRLVVQAESGVRFAGIHGTNVQESSDRLRLAAGESVFCKLTSATESTAPRLELIYHKTRKA